MSDEPLSEADQETVNLLKSVTEAPTAWRTTPAAILASGRALHRRRRLTGISGSIAITAVVVLGLSAVVSEGRASDVVAAAPSAGDSGIAQEPRPCDQKSDGSFTDEEVTSDAVQLASDEIAKLGYSRLGRPVYTGLKVCEPTQSVSVYRVAGKAKFDKDVKSIARRHDVGLRFVETKYAMETLEKVNNEVTARREALAQGGAPIVLLARRTEGYVEVGVEKNVAAAQEILHDLGDKVQVVEMEPTPNPRLEVPVGPTGPNG